MYLTSFNDQYIEQNIAEAIAWRCSVKKPQASNFIKKDTLAQMFFCEFCEISKNTFYYRTPLVGASDIGFYSFKSCHWKIFYKIAVLNQSWTNYNGHWRCSILLKLQVILWYFSKILTIKSSSWIPSRGMEVW